MSSDNDNNITNPTFHIVRTQDKPWAQVNKATIEDSRLSWKATGLLSYLLQSPDVYDKRVNDLVKIKTDGSTSLSSAIKELIRFGYIQRIRSRNSLGQHTGVKYLVYENPQENFSVEGGQDE